MRRLIVAMLCLIAALVANPYASWPTSAQESPSPEHLAQDVTVEPVTGELVPPLVAEGADIRLERAVFAPGATYTIAGVNTELLLVTVESGTLDVQSSAPLVINRAGESTAATLSQEWVAADTEFTLARGDSFVRPAGSHQELRNSSEGLSAALMASISSAVADATASDAMTASGNGGLVIALAVVVVPECEEGYTPAEATPVATPGGGGGGGGAGGVAVAIAAAPECVGGAVESERAPTGTPQP